MRVESVNSNITFKKQIRIPLKNKAVYAGLKDTSPMDKVINIASSNSTGLVISTDVLILDSTDKIKSGLEEAGIAFEEVEDVI